MGIEHISNLMINDYKISKRNLITKSLMIKELEDRGYVTNTKRDKKNYSAELARNRADYLANKLSNHSSWPFYLKCAWNLTDAYLDYLLKVALTKENPIKYFSAAAAKEMRANS